MSSFISKNAALRGLLDQHLASLSQKEGLAPENEIRVRPLDILDDAEWNSIGHVPFKEKDKVYKQYKALIDTLLGAFHQHEATRKVARFKDSIKEGMNIGRERERLLRIYENMCGEIKTYENNIGFFNSSSKKGNNMVQDLERKIQNLKQDLSIIIEQINALDN